MRFAKYLPLLGLLFYSSCASNNFYYDKTIPEEQLCTLKIPEHITVVKFDNADVNWKIRWGGPVFAPIKEAFVKIPAGEHTLTLNYFRQRSDGRYIYTSKANDMDITYEFLPGKTHSLSERIVGDTIHLYIF